MKKIIITFELLILVIIFINYEFSNNFLKENILEKRNVSRILLLEGDTETETTNNDETTTDDGDENSDDDKIFNNDSSDNNEQNNNENDNENNNNSEEDNDTSAEQTTNENNPISNPYDEIVDDDTVETKPQDNSTEITTDKNAITTGNNEITENPKTGSAAYMVIFVMIISIIGVIYAGKGLKNNN